MSIRSVYTRNIYAVVVFIIETWVGKIWYIHMLGCKALAEWRTAVWFFFWKNKNKHPFFPESLVTTEQRNSSTQIYLLKQWVYWGYLKNVREVVYKWFKVSYTSRKQYLIIIMFSLFCHSQPLPPCYHDWTIFYMFLNMKICKCHFLCMLSFTHAGVITHENGFPRVPCPSCKQPPLTGTAFGFCNSTWGFVNILHEP